MQLDLFEYVWLTSFQITKKSHQEIKILLRNDIPFPTLARENRGDTIYLAKPKKKDNGKASYLGLLFNLSNEAEKRLLWQTFKASVFHLSMHIAASDFNAYAELSQGKDVDLATFTASIIEDATVRAFLKTQWTPFINDVALANTLSYLKMKPIHLISNPALQLMTSVISTFSIGTTKGKASDRLISDVNRIVANLESIESMIEKELRKTEELELQEKTFETLGNLVSKQKIEGAKAIFRVVEKYGKPSEVPSLLHTENHGCSSIFFGNNVPSQSDIERHLPLASDLLKQNTCQDKTQACATEKSLDNEVSQVFSALEAKEAAQEKILQDYRMLGSSSRFHSFEFPNEDFSEYVYIKSLLSSQIRRVLEKLRLYKNQTGEDYRHEVGLLDMQEAIQVIASKSRRTDVFVRDELQAREDTWAILVDASHSLESFVGEVRGTALCLSEVARELFTNQNSWSEFAFNDKFYVIKDFSENYNNNIRARIGGLEHGGMTYISDAMSLTADAMKRRTEEIKLLVVVSDFFPVDYDAHAEDRLIQCVKKIEKSGMGLIGIGVKSRAAKKYFRINCVVDNPYELMKKFVTAFFEFSSTT